MSTTFRLAVLECDTPVPNVNETRGSYGEVFRQLLSKGLNGLGERGSQVQLDLSKWDVVAEQKYPQLGDIDGILLTGSKHTAYKDDAWIVSLVSYIKTVLTTSKTPVVGICFGHQIIGRALGAKTGAAPGGWEISVEKVDLSDEGKKLFGLPTLKLHHMHKDEVAEVPAGLANLGSSPRCAVQGLYKPGCVLSLQAHPEFDGFIMSEILSLRHQQGVFDDKMYGDGSRRASDAHDGVFIATKIWEFLLDTLP